MKIKESLLKISLITTLLSMHPYLAYASEMKTQAKPNIILLFADDMGWADISAQGAKTPTPNLDHLAAMGQRWTNFYVPSPVCSPSRGALMTGRLETRTGLYGTKSPVFVEEDPDGFPDSEITIADSLKNGGYKTIMYGKWHLGAQSAGFPTRHGFDEWYGIPISNDRFNTVVDQVELDRLRKTKADPTKAAELFKKIQDTNIHPQQKYWGVPLYHSYKVNGKYVDYVVPQGFQQASFTKNVTEKATKYIADNKDNPFFMYMAYPQTHVPLFSSREYEGKGKNRYGDIMLEIDWSVGEIYKSLEKNKIADNTIVIFTSDNGPWLIYDKEGIAGSALPMHGGKSTEYEGGARVPFIVNWKSHIKPGVVDGIGSTLDLLPTLMDISGVTHSQKLLDGKNLSSTFLNEEKSPRTFMPYFYMGNMYAYRSGDYKVTLMKIQDGKMVSLETPMLFNLKNDISEKNDLARQEPDKLSFLIKQAEEYQKQLGVKKAPLFDM